MALGLITTGMEDSVQTSLNDVGAEITISNSTSIGGNSGMIQTSTVEDLKNISGVIDTAGELSLTEAPQQSSQGGGPNAGPSSTSTTIGISPDKLYMVGIKDIDGKPYNTNTTEAVVGAQYAEMNNISIGDTITIQNKEFEVTGIYETGSLFADGGVYVPLDTLQNLTGTGEVSTVLVKTGEGVNDSAISEKIEQKYDDLFALTSEEMSTMVENVTGILNTASFAVSALAIVVGAIGIVNTMVMTVYERTKEIGVLKSVGWKSKRILLMILGETLVLTILSGVIGSLFGILICEVGVRLMGIDNFSLGYSPRTFMLAFGITIIVGIIGGIYPAYKASRLAPTEALRYE